MPTEPNKPSGFDGFTANMANNAEDVARATKQFMSKVFSIRWADAAEGTIIEAPVAPRRYLVVGLSLGSVRLLATLDFGAPGWFSSRCHVMTKDATQ